LNIWTTVVALGVFIPPENLPQRLADERRRA
jgi:hypothetical protein